MSSLNGVLSALLGGLGSIMKFLGYSLSHPIIFLFRIALLYLAAINLIAFILRYLNFPYWRLFEHLKYLVMLAALAAHLYNTLGDLGSGLILNILAISCATVVCLYIVDFAWVIG